MEAVLERGTGAAGIRLLQDAFNTQSMSLYASLGFEVKEPVVVMGGTLRRPAAPGIDVRPLTHGDLEACEQLHLGVHGFRAMGSATSGWGWRSPVTSSAGAASGGGPCSTRTRAGTGRSTRTPATRAAPTCATGSCSRR
jgi:hypothetical protein